MNGVTRIIWEPLHKEFYNFLQTEKPDPKIYRMIFQPLNEISTWHLNSLDSYETN